MAENRRGNHTVTQLTVPIVWVTQEYPELQKRDWGRHFWAIGYGAGSTGRMSAQMVEEYLEHHRHPSNGESENFMLE